MRSSAWRGAVALMAVVLAAGACELAKVNIPVQQSTLVVHGVLSSSAPSQTILVERTLTGEVTLYPYAPPNSLAPVGSFSSSEQILSDWGNPESHATVEIVKPDGQVVTAAEYMTFTSTGQGAGMYRALIPGNTLVAGGLYRLRVRTTRGEVVTAETVVPATSSAAPATLSSFDRTGAPLGLSWGQEGTARGYEVRVDNPYLPWFAITDGTQFALDGLLRNTITDNYAHVFIPGFRQNVSVSAVDQNLYEYYRTVNSGFTGSGIVNRMQGAIGVFGSYVTILRRTLDVTAPPTQPVEGTFDEIPRADGEKYGTIVGAATLLIYVESPSARSGQPDAISARAIRSNGAFGFAAIGTKLRDSVRLNFLVSQSVADTSEWFKGALHGDTLDVRFSKGAGARYVRRR